MTDEHNKQAEHLIRTAMECLEAQTERADIQQARADAYNRIIELLETENEGLKKRVAELEQGVAELEQVFNWADSWDKLQSKLFYLTISNKEFDNLLATEINTDSCFTNAATFREKFISQDQVDIAIADIRAQLVCDLRSEAEGGRDAV